MTDPLSVTCPNCGMVAGQGCRTRSGTPIAGNVGTIEFHESRVRAAQAIDELQPWDER